jgi:hypothetical protein
MRGLASASILVAAFIIQADQQVSAGCSTPAPGMKAKGQPNVDGETVAFNFRGESFSLDVFSGYAQNPNSRTYCLRYEAENTSSKTIQVFHWPLASGWQIESLEPKKRPTIAVTTLSGSPPVLGSTWIYAFLSETAKTIAYQQNKQFVPFLDYRRPTSQADLAADIGFTRISYARMVQFEGIEAAEPKKFTVIGTEFADGGAEVKATSFSEWNGKNFLISAVVERSGIVKEVQAPFTYALYKAGRPSELLSLIREFRSTLLPLRDNSFISNYVSEPNARFVYIVQQPITLVGPSGRVCFLAPAYSPIPIPQELMTCDIAKR